MWPALNDFAEYPREKEPAPAASESKGQLIPGPWAPAPPEPPAVPAVAFRVFLAHSIHTDDETIDFWCRRIQEQVQEAAGPTHAVTVLSGRDAFKRMSGANPGKQVWARYVREIAAGYTDTFPLGPSYHLYVVPASPLRPLVGRGTANLLTMAIDMGRSVRLWDPETGHDWAVGQCQCMNSKDAAHGYQLVPRG